MTSLSARAVVGHSFNRPIPGVRCRDQVARLTTASGYAFNKPVADVWWPACLEEPSFGGGFNFPIVERHKPKDSSCREGGHRTPLMG